MGVALGPLVSVIVAVGVSVGVSVGLWLAVGVIVSVGLGGSVGVSLVEGVSVSAGGLGVAVTCLVVSMGRLQAMEIKLNNKNTGIIFLMILFYSLSGSLSCFDTRRI